MCRRRSCFEAEMRHTCAPARKSEQVTPGSREWGASAIGKVILGQVSERAESELGFGGGVLRGGETGAKAQG